MKLAFFGVHSALPMFQARKLCPQGVFLPVRMSRYREVSHQIMAILAGISPLVEQVSIDEAYVDLTGTEKMHGPLLEFARRLKIEIKEKTGLTCSIGLAPNKFLAKIASDLQKPDGLTIIPAAEVPVFLETLPLAKIPGVGAKTMARLQSLGVTKTGELLDYPRAYLAETIGQERPAPLRKGTGAGSDTGYFLY